MEEDEIKLSALENAIYHPTHKNDTAIYTVKVETFNVEYIKEQVKQSVELLSYHVSYKPIIVEILDILHQNKNIFLIEQQKYITFYWNGMLVLLIEIKNDNIKHDKQLHISLQKYKTEKKSKIDERDTKISEKKVNQTVIYGAGTTVVASLLLVGWTILKMK